MRSIGVAVCLLFTVASVCGKSADQWKSRVIYQLLTDRFAQTTDPSSACSNLNDYCGGSFEGIINKLDYIQGMGFNAIWISPIPQQTPHGYHGYWQMNINNINSHFGSSSELEDLVTECHSRGIWVMLDVVANHMGNQHYKDWSNFTFFTPFDQSEYYHPYCLITDFTNQHEVEVCRLDNLPDLDQSNSFVLSTLTNWIHTTVSKYGFDGIRCDTVPEINKDFWSKYAQAAGVYQVGEVFNGDPNYVAGYQGPLTATLNYPMYYKLRDTFQSKRSMREIHNGMNASRAAFSDISVLGNFLDNHDNDRFLHINSDWSTLKNALAYNVFAEGIPIIYYGTEQAFNGYDDGVHPGGNRESLWPHYDTSSLLYEYISTIVKFKVAQGSAVYEQEQVERYVDDQFFAFTRGMVFVATTNIGSGQSLSRKISYHPYSDGTKLVNLLDSSDTVTVSGGAFMVDIQNGQPIIYYPASSGREEEAMPVEPVTPVGDAVEEGEGGRLDSVVVGATGESLSDSRDQSTGNSVGSVVLALVLVALVVGVAAAVLVVWRRRRVYTAYTAI